MCFRAAGGVPVPCESRVPSPQLMVQLPGLLCDASNFSDRVWNPRGVLPSIQAFGGAAATFTATVSSAVALAWSTTCRCAM